MRRRKRRSGVGAMISSPLHQFHLAQLRRFLSFIYTDYRTGFSFRADLLPLYWDREPEKVRELFAGKEPSILPDRELEELLEIQDTIRKGFHEWMGKLERGQTVEVPRDKHTLGISEWPGEGKVFRLQVEVGVRGPGGDWAPLLLQHVASHLDGLRPQALRRCQRKECGRYFLDSEQRKAVHCSQSCRFIVYEERRERPARRKGRKKGISW